MFLVTSIPFSEFCLYLRRLFTTTGLATNSFTALLAKGKLLAAYPRILFSLCLIYLSSASIRAQEVMTARQFEKIVATPSDTKALRPEIALLPHFALAKGTVVFTYPKGHKIEEKCTQTAKTIDGKYIVYAITSDSLNKPAYAIAGYDEKASAILLWSLTGAELSKKIIVVDAARKIYASTSTFGNGFMELTVGSCSPKEEYEHTLTYKNGVLAMTREVTLCPVPAVKGVESTPPD